MYHSITIVSTIFLLVFSFNTCPPQPAPECKSSSPQPEATLELTPRPVITDVAHKKICYSKNTCCFHPRHGAFGYFGKGEIVASHNHAPYSSP